MRQGTWRPHARRRTRADGVSQRDVAHSDGGVEVLGDTAHGRRFAYCEATSILASSASTSSPSSVRDRYAVCFEHVTPRTRTRRSVETCGASTQTDPIGPEPPPSPSAARVGLAHGPHSLQAIRAAVEPTGIEPVTSCLQSRSSGADWLRYRRCEHPNRALDTGFTARLVPDVVPARSWYRMAWSGTGTCQVALGMDAKKLLGRARWNSRRFARGEAPTAPRSSRRSGGRALMAGR